MGTIVIDPGHGGEEKVGGSSPNNAFGPTGLLEKTVTLGVGLLLAQRLEEQGHHVILTRDGDFNVGLEDRARHGQEAKADVFLSIHFNGYNARAQGTETFVHPSAQGPSIALAKLVQEHTLAITKLSDRGVKRGAYKVLKPSFHDKRTAVCLVEVSFMDLPEEEARLLDDAYLDAIAGGLDAAIEAYLSRVGTFAAYIELPIDDEMEDGYEELVR